MELETPRSPGHCLGILNAHMWADMLRHVHDGVRTRRQSPLDMLIASIKDVLATFDGTALFASEL
jgi:hypothetical protein